MNYGQLRTNFEALLKRRDLTPTQRDLWIQEAISRCASMLRVPAMEKSAKVVMIPAFEGAVFIPKDYLQLRSISVGDGELLQRDFTTVLSAKKVEGPPAIFAQHGRQWIFAPNPPAGTELRVDYYADIPLLVDAADANWISEIKPFAVLYGALSLACAYFLDRREEMFESRFAQAISELQGQADMDSLIGAAASPAFTFPND